MKKFLAILMTVVMTAMLFGVLAGSALAEEAQAPEDGVYTVSVELEGGSGKATIQSPCKIEMKDGQIELGMDFAGETLDSYQVILIMDEEDTEQGTYVSGEIRVFFGEAEEPLYTLTTGDYKAG